MNTIVTCGRRVVAEVVVRSEAAATFASIMRPAMRPGRTWFVRPPSVPANGFRPVTRTSHAICSRAFVYRSFVPDVIHVCWRLILAKVINAFHHWRVVNATQVHPFHIHQVHVLIYAENGTRLANPEWLDTVNVPVEGSVDLMMDFTDPIIRGVSLFHCHLLSHEDKGMMAKILFK
jgi:hypothetical protein